jgi:hypothetical protein
MKTELCKDVEIMSSMPYETSGDMEKLINNQHIEAF